MRSNQTIKNIETPNEIDKRQGARPMLLTWSAVNWIGMSGNKALGPQEKMSPEDQTPMTMSAEYEGTSFHEHPGDACLANQLLQAYVSTLEK